MRLLALFLPALRLAQNYFEEDLLKSRPIREAQYTQMKEYAASLPARPAPTGDTLQAAIGYPAPGIKAKGPARIEKIGEDELGTYSRMWIRVSPRMEVYGLYLVPKVIE